MIDEQYISKLINTRDKVVLELGCGERKRHPDALGIDIIDYPGVDLVGDIFTILSYFPNDAVDEIYSYHFVEHIEQLDELITEVARVIKPEGTALFVAPHFSNPYFYSDPTHSKHFGLYTFCYLADSRLFRRPIPRYKKILLFDLESVDLVFKSTRPFYVRHIIKRIIGYVFNLNGYMKELYEENYCYLFPCYEVRYRLKRKSMIRS